MRLIDADRLIDALNDYEFDNFAKVGHEKEFAVVETIRDGIFNFRTAYDIDKVVEELEMELKASSGYSAERVSAFSRAIEIVKVGGNK